MSITVVAIYENGILRPRQPLELAEGAEVRLTISAAKADLVSAAEIERAVGARLDQLAALEPNWDGYGAPALNRGIIAAARQFVGRLASCITVQPLVVPISSGALQLEWHRGQKILELEIEDATSIHYLKWDPATGLEEEDIFPISDSAKGASLIGWFMGAACFADRGHTGTHVILALRQHRRPPA